MYKVIPLSAVADQEVYATVSANGGEIPLTLRVRWNDDAGVFVLTVSDGGGEALLAGVPLVTGLAPAHDLLEAYRYLGIGGAVLLPARVEGFEATPTIQTLGVDYQLLWGDDS